MVPALVRAGKHDGHVELSPSLLLDPERRLLECLLVLLETRMQIVESLLKAIRRNLVALIVDQPDFDAPAAHREALHGGGLADGALLRYELDRALDLPFLLAARSLAFPIFIAWEMHKGRARVRTSGMLGKSAYVWLEEWPVGAGRARAIGALSR